MFRRVCQHICRKALYILVGTNLLVETEAHFANRFELIVHPLLRTWFCPHQRQVLVSDQITPRRNRTQRSSELSVITTATVYGRVMWFVHASRTRLR